MSQDNSGDDAGQDRYGKTVADVPDGSAVRQKEEKGKRRRLSSGFFRFIIVRFLLIIPTIFILVTLVFFVMRATGDPASSLLAMRTRSHLPMRTLQNYARGASSAVTPSP